MNAVHKYFHVLIFAKPKPMLKYGKWYNPQIHQYSMYLHKVFTSLEDRASFIFRVLNWRSEIYGINLLGFVKDEIYFTCIFVIKVDFERAVILILSKVRISSELV